MRAAYFSNHLTQTCVSDFPVMAFQPGEKQATVVRVICTLISASIISSWFKKKIIGRYLLFFAHWLSGLFHQLAEMVLAQMVLLCWSKSNALVFIHAMKFVELAAGNMLAVTNVAICVNLALIVSSHHTMSNVKSLTSPALILCFLAVSLVTTIAVVPFWETVTMSGTLFWSVNNDNDKHTWVMTSIFFMELVAGTIMAVIGTLLVVFRWRELCQVWRLHRRIKFYIALSVIATLVDLSIGIGGVVYVLHDRYKEMLITLTWTARHVHIALDTLVLYSALGVTAKIEMDSRGVRQSDEVSVPESSRSSITLGRRRGLPAGYALSSSISPDPTV